MEIIEQSIPRYANFGNRLLAFIIDSIILSFITAIIYVPAIFFFGLKDFIDRPRGVEEDEALEFAIQIVGVFGLLFLLTILVYWLYYAYQESGIHQATFGKRAMSIKVTDLNGNRISFAKASGRFFGKILSRMIMWIGFIMAAFTEKKQALHDIIAETLVIES